MKEAVAAARKISASFQKGHDIECIKILCGKLKTHGARKIGRLAAKVLAPPPPVSAGA